ncbi:MAG: hypothetical protein AB1589_36495 [Cyanobacteriota bacterium]
MHRFVVIPQVLPEEYRWSRCGLIVPRATKPTLAEGAIASSNSRKYSNTKLTPSTVLSSMSIQWHTKSKPTRVAPRGLANFELLHNPLDTGYRQQLALVRPLANLQIDPLSTIP